MDLAELKDRACAEADALRPAMEAVASAIHKDPEVGWDTPRSAARLEDFLESQGMAVERDVALHSPALAAAADSDLGRDAMNRVAKVLAMCALDLIADPARLHATQAEHRAKTATPRQEA